MLKTVSSITNAIGAVNYKGTWNAATNTPTLASGVGSKGDYYVVSVAGTTTIDGISNWGVGDQIVFNGATWNRLDGGADGNFVNLSASGDTQLSSASLVLGKQYALTSFSGTTAVIDTGIIAALATASTAQMYQVDIKVNISPGGPSAYRAVASYLVGVGVGTSTKIEQTLLHRTDQPALGDVTMTSTFWDGATESATISSGGPWQIRLKLDTIYSNPSASLQCRITQLTP